jgi:Flp pilus assembly protein TadD
MARLSSRDLLRSASKLAIVTTTATLLTGCGGFSSMMGSSDAAPETQMASSPRELTQPADQDYVAGAAYWGARFEANKSDIDAALNFARNLRLMGGARQAVTVMKQFVMNHPDDARVLSEYGKALTAAGRAADAVPFLARASQINGNDWSTLSAYGVALDQVGDHAQARDSYLAALNLSPNNAIVQSNLALSYLLEGKVDLAEPILRQLVARPDATPQMRQNLAMVESIRGNRGAAEQLVRTDLPKTEADNNLAVFNQLSESNAVDVKPIAPPLSQKPASSTPATTATPRARVTMAPIADDDEAPSAAPEPAAAPKPAVATAPATTATPAAATATAAPTAPTKQIVTMSPIADDEGDPATPTQPNPATPATAAAPASAPATAAPTAAAPAAAQETPAATAAPTQTAPESSQSSEATDPFRPRKEINVASSR